MMTLRKEQRMSTNKVLLVDDDEIVRFTLAGVLEQSGFAVTCAANVVEALRHITSGPYDALLSDLHMPGPGDGLTVISAMRHVNPSAVTLLLSAFPHLEAAAQAILFQADEILVKPMEVTSLVHVIKQRLAIGPVRDRQVESLAAILERTTGSTIQEWYKLVLKEKLVMSVPMSHDLRCGHLPQLFRELAARLRASTPIGSKGAVSPPAALHGLNRRRSGYSAAMLVEESRILQVTIFKTLENHLATIDPSLLLPGVMTIADEVDSQLSQTMAGFLGDSLPDAQPVWAQRRP
jgi:CheY-like chemotaxis protein